MSSSTCRIWKRRSFQANRVLRDQLGGKRLLFTDRQRRRLAARATAIGRGGLFEISTLVTPDTLLQWYRRLIAKKYDGNKNRSIVRPKTAVEIEELIVLMRPRRARRAEPARALASPTAGSESWACQESRLGLHGHERGNLGNRQDLDLTDHRASPRPYPG